MSDKHTVYDTDSCHWSSGLICITKDFQKIIVRVNREQGELKLPMEQSLLVKCKYQLEEEWFRESLEGTAERAVTANTGLRIQLRGFAEGYNWGGRGMIHDTHMSPVCMELVSDTKKSVETASGESANHTAHIITWYWATFRPGFWRKALANGWSVEVMSINEAISKLPAVQAQLVERVVALMPHANLTEPRFKKWEERHKEKGHLTLAVKMSEDHIIHDLSRVSLRSGWICINKDSQKVLVYVNRKERILKFPSYQNQWVRRHNGEFKDEWFRESSEEIAKRFVNGKPGYNIQLRGYAVEDLPEGGARMIDTKHYFPVCTDIQYATKYSTEDKSRGSADHPSCITTWYWATYTGKNLTANLGDWSIEEIPFDMAKSWLPAAQAGYLQKVVDVMPGANISTAFSLWESIFGKRS